LYSVVMSTRKKLLLTLPIVALAASLLYVWHSRRATIKVMGAVITQNTDPRKQRPIEGVVVTASDKVSVARATTYANGFFSFTFRKRLLQGRPTIKLTFQHPDYQPAEMTARVTGDLTVAKLTPLAAPKRPDAGAPKQTIGNVVVRYSIKAASVLTVGSAGRSFEVENIGNVPCNGRPPCSPDGRWKAAMGSVSLDAGAGNEFRNARASCIAGPCPFTKIDTEGLSNPGRTISVSTLAWSDTATFLVEAEVVHPTVSDVVRNSYPVIFGDALNFTLPPSAEAVSLQAEVNGQSIVFPLGPALLLSWADCSTRSNPDETRVYRCELKPGYRWAGAPS
jgi:hypothetical protein